MDSVRMIYVSDMFGKLYNNQMIYGYMCESCKYISFYRHSGNGPVGMCYCPRCGKNVKSFLNGKTETTVTPNL